MGNGKRERECVVPKILIVDDDPDIVDAGRLVLEREGYQVESASNRADGMKALDEVKPDLLILDVMMEEPDDGLRMAREIRKERIDTAKEKVRGALRSALMEQLENARRWHTAKPDRKGYDPDEYRFAEPVMEQLNTLARDVDLPSDLAGYLIWLVAHVRRTWA